MDYNHSDTRVYNRLPWVEDEFQCLDCGAQWVGRRTIGTDESQFPCPQCDATNSEVGWTDEPVTIH